MLVNDGTTLTKSVSNDRGVSSTLSHTDELTNSNMKALAAKDMSFHVLELERNRRFDIFVVRCRATYDNNLTVTQRGKPSLGSAVCETIGIVAPCAN